jgi:hypothetical protein
MLNSNTIFLYSGKKRTRYFQAVPTLFDQCIMVLQDHVEDIDEVPVPYMQFRYSNRPQSLNPYRGTICDMLYE